MYLLSDEFANGAETIRVKEEEQGDELGEEEEEEEGGRGRNRFF